MKTTYAIAALAALVLAPSAHATCKEAARWAAEKEYGNDPVRTQVRTIEEGKEYLVTVGIGNPEDGAHSYRVYFPGNVCDPRFAEVSETN
jgi:Cu/Zn superoxide dismutase